MPSCQSCQAQVPEGARFCPACGYEFAAAPTLTAWPMPPPPSRRSSASSSGSSIRSASGTEPPPANGAPPPDDAGNGAHAPQVASPQAAPAPPAQVVGSQTSFQGAPAHPPPRQSVPRSVRSIGAGKFGAAPQVGVSQSSILSGSSIDGSRFAPGMILAERYRIVKQIGKGGMGEVYLADDLMLVSPVALKFLPPHLAYNRTSLDRFFNEVRIARAVSHPNVCRVHDISEVEGQHFISMEYVDGEDLASVLRRFGKLPAEKGLQVARQLCAGLAAAHDRGVLHRDLKPANVMIDGRGAVRITDFGLAGLAAELRGQQGRAGTPAYMAPEQFSGQGVTNRSDVYSLGLVLYEIFTGKPVFRPETLEQLSRMHDQGPPLLSTIVPDIDPGIERVVLRCLERDPSLRPKSAMTVSAALPGGDPLAEALAAGETPSPELVAASGSRGVLRPGVALGLLLAVAVALVVVAALNQKTKLFAHVPLERSREILTGAALQVLDDLKPSHEHADRAMGFVEDRRMLEGLKKLAKGSAVASGADDPGRLSKGYPPVVRFWYRESPTPMSPRSIVRGVQLDDPPLSEPGMTRVVLDTEGRLIEYVAVPDARALAGPVAPPGPPPTDWAAILKFARLDPLKLRETTPSMVPPVFCDQRAAWDGHFPERPELAMHVEGGALRGLPVYFQVRATELGEVDRTAGDNAAGSIVLGVTLLTVLYATPLGIAVYNIKRGRGDRRGALRLAMVMFVAVLIQKLLGMHYGLSLADASERYVRALGDALHVTALAWVCYMAIEPIIRRQRPETIISWTRLLAGAWKDPLVGRDLLIGCAIGSAWPLLLGFFALASPVVGSERPLPQGINTETLTGMRQSAAVLVNLGLDSLLYPLAIALLDLVARWMVANPLTHRTVHFTLMSILFLYIIVNQVGTSFNVLFILLAVLAGCGCGYIAQRFGLLMLVSAFFSAGVLSSFPVALGLPSWIAGTCLTAMIVIIAIAAFGFVTSLAGRKILSADMFGKI